MNVLMLFSILRIISAAFLQKYDFRISDRIVEMPKHQVGQKNFGGGGGSVQICLDTKKRSKSRNQRSFHPPPLDGFWRPNGGQNSVMGSTLNFTANKTL